MICQEILELITCAVDAVELITSQGVLKQMGWYREELMICQEILELIT